MTSDFHKNIDIDRFYMPRKLGGRGIKEIMTAYECRIVSAIQYLTQSKKNNKYLNKNWKWRKWYLYYQNCKWINKPILN